MHLALIRVAKTMAVLGALVLSFLIVMTCVSVLGRELNGLLNSSFAKTHVAELSKTLLDAGIKPVLGDFELLENMMPFAIFAFLPLAQVSSSHATVDVFTARFPETVLMWMRVITEVVFAVVLIVFAYKLYEGMQAKMRYNETTYLIQFPVWWAYAAAVGAAVVSALVGVAMAGMLLTEALTGKALRLDSADSQ